MFLELKLKFACTKMVSSVSGHSWKEKTTKLRYSHFKRTPLLTVVMVMCGLLLLFTALLSLTV